jgi:hypothetical protein
MQRTHFENGRNAFPDEANRGMTLRDYFAAQAMPALVGNFLSKDLDSIDPEGWMDGLAMDAYSMADAMLKRREE